MAQRLTEAYGLRAPLLFDLFRSGMCACHSVKNDMRYQHAICDGRITDNVNMCCIGDQ